MQAPQPDVLVSNVLDNPGPREPVWPQSEAFADVVFAAGVLALVVTDCVVVGMRWGGPVPTLRFWTIFGPLLLLPLAILLGLLLAPGGVMLGAASWRPRAVLGLSGFSAFVVGLLLLNLPSVLATR